MDKITFKPRSTNIIRYHLISSLVIIPVVMGVLALLDANLAITFSWKRTLLWWLVVSSAAILVQLLARFLLLKKSLEVLSITISDRHIVGPQGWRRKSFEIGRLDKARSHHRNLYQRLVGARSLRFRDGDELEIYDAFYGKEQIDRLLQVLQLEN